MKIDNIHGLPTPPPGFRLAVQGDEKCHGIREWNDDEWMRILPEYGRLEPNAFYAIPLDDGYEYFEAGTTTIQAGDELQWALDYWERAAPGRIGCKNPCNPLRRPKVKVCATRDGTGLVMTQAGAGTYEFDCPDCTEAKPPAKAHQRDSSDLKPGDRVIVKDGQWCTKPPGSIGVIEKLSESGIPIVDFGTPGGHHFIAFEHLEKAPVPGENPCPWVTLQVSCGLHEIAGRKYNLNEIQGKAIIQLLEAMQ
jgi:hypothetical protein